MLPRLKNIFRNEMHPIFLSGASDCSYSKFVLIRGPTLAKKDMVSLAGLDNTDVAGKKAMIETAVLA